MRQRLTPTVGPCDQDLVDFATLHSWQGRCSISAVSPSLKHMLSMKQVPLWSVVSAGVAPQVSTHLRRGHTKASAVWVRRTFAAGASIRVALRRWGAHHGVSSAAPVLNLTAMNCSPISLWASGSVWIGLSTPLELVTEVE